MYLVLERESILSSLWRMFFRFLEEDLYCFVYRRRFGLFSDFLSFSCNVMLSYLRWLLKNKWLLFTSLKIDSFGYVGRDSKDITENSDGRTCKPLFSSQCYKITATYATLVQVRTRDCFLFLNRPDNVLKLSVEAMNILSWTSISVAWRPQV